MSSPLNQHTVVGCVLAVLLSAGWSAPSLASNALPPPLLDVRTWPRMSVGAFGCYLEKSLGHRDPRFNCALKHYQNKGDPCKNTEAYYEGPDFPVSLALHVHPLATDVKLDWEHGELQSVTITLKAAGTRRKSGACSNCHVHRLPNWPRQKKGRLWPKTSWTPACNTRRIPGMTPRGAGQAILRTAPPR